MVRVYESTGSAATGSLRLAGMRRAWKSDLREARADELPVSDERLTLHLNPFEIATYRILRKADA